MFLFSFFVSLHIIPNQINNNMAPATADAPCAAYGCGGSRRRKACRRGGKKTHRVKYRRVKTHRRIRNGGGGDCYEC